MVAFTGLLLGFLISLIVSTIIIYVVSKLFGETEGLNTAIIAALVGYIIFGIAYYFLGSGLWASIIAGIAWLIALRSLYAIGWIKSLVIAFVIWSFATIIRLVLPTIAGAL